VGSNPTLSAIPLVFNRVMNAHGGLLALIHRTTRFSARRLLALALLCATACFSLASAQTTAPPPAAGVRQRPGAADLNRKVHLTGDLSTLPLVLVGGYPFLEGEVNGIKGKLLFDVGEKDSFALNSHKITPPNGKVIGSGYFGSGQTFTVSSFPVVDELKLAGGPDFTAVPSVRGSSGQQLEDNITPDFIGWIGIAFFDGYVVKLNYQRPSVTFYKNDAPGAGKQAALKGEKVLQVIHFDNAGHPNLLTLPVMIGDLPFVANIDTGSHDTLWFTPELMEKMKAAGTLYCTTDECTLSNVSIDNHVISLKSHTDLIEGKASISDQIGHPNDNIMTLGYEFLNKYKTVWDFQDQTLTLLSTETPEKPGTSASVLVPDKK
jgi:hypothetical protein